MWNIPEKASAEVEDNGFYSGEDMISSEVLGDIQRELKEWKEVPAINGYGCLYHDNDALLQNLALYSPTSLRLALSEEILDFMENHYGEPVLLSKIEYRRALVPKPKMPLHSDNSSSILVFVYLNGVDDASGMTAVIPGTHRIGASQNNGSPQVPAHAEREIGRELFPVKGKQGVCLFFEANIWHCRMASIRSGREIIWFGYVPISEKDQCINIVLSRESVEGLNERQMGALGLKMSGVGNRKSEDFRLSKERNVDSLYLLSNSFIIRALISNIFTLLRNSIPRSIKNTLKWALKVRNYAPRKTD